MRHLGMGGEQGTTYGYGPTPPVIGSAGGTYHSSVAQCVGLGIGLRSGTMRPSGGRGW